MKMSFGLGCRVLMVVMIGLPVLGTGGHRVLSQELYKDPTPAKSWPCSDETKNKNLQSTKRKVPKYKSSTRFDEPRLNGCYAATLSFPKGEPSRSAQVEIKGSEFALKLDQDGQDVIFKGTILTMTTKSYTAVNLRIKKPNGTFESLSLKLKQDGNKIVFTSVKEEDKSFQLTLQCPDYPGCLESDPCIPTCDPPRGSKRHGRRG